MGGEDDDVMFLVQRCESMKLSSLRTLNGIFVPILKWLSWLIIEMHKVIMRAHLFHKHPCGKG